VIDYEIVEADRRKPLIYCAHRYHSSHYSLSICKFVLLRGGIPIVPFLVFPTNVVDGGMGMTREQILSLDISLMSKCDKLWVFSDSEDSDGLGGGVGEEISYWLEKSNTPIEYFVITEVIVQE